MSNGSNVFLRQQLLIDEHVQGSLLKRTALYGAACATYFVVILIFAESMSRQDGTILDAALRCLDEAIYWAPGLLLLAPLVAYDMLKLTNRFAGPMFRLRREMQRLIAHESEYPLNFREDDYWTELAVEFNKIREEVMELRIANQKLSKEKSPVSVKLFDEADNDDGEDSLDSLFNETQTDRRQLAGDIDQRNN